MDVSDVTVACRNFDQVTADWQGATISMKKNVQVWDVPRLTYHFCVSQTCTGVGGALTNIMLAKAETHSSDMLAKAPLTPVQV